MWTREDRALGIVCVSGGLCVLLVFHRIWGSLDNALSKKKAIASLVRTGMALVWPVLLLSFVCPDDKSNSVLLLPLLCSTGFWFIDAQLMHHSPSGQSEKPASLRLEPSSLTGLAFGLCGIVGSRPESKYSYLFLYAIVGCLVLVLPSHNLEPGCLAEQLFESIQKGALMWCIGLLLAAVILTRHNTCTNKEATAEVTTQETPFPRGHSR